MKTKIKTNFTRSGNQTEIQVAQYKSKEKTEILNNSNKRQLLAEKHQKLNVRYRRQKYLVSLQLNIFNILQLSLNTFNTYMFLHI